PKSPLEEMDSRIAAKAAELAGKETAYEEERTATETNLLDLETRKTEILLGKIYKAVQDISRKEGISVVVDKGSILYGHDAVDLTDKVLKHLKGA
ncbi:MAG: OmpH family outer membrane protein, partial [Elusimicrobia bacterium]|nr:OmpH family outer membrane protein [Elusimicrobiota bacterium]